MDEGVNVTVITLGGLFTHMQQYGSIFFCLILLMYLQHHRPDPEPAKPSATHIRSDRSLIDQLCPLWHCRPPKAARGPGVREPDRIAFILSPSVLPLLLVSRFRVFAAGLYGL